MRVENKRNYLKQSGITLIALVVTIVVLLILAGVSVNALFGNSGIIEKAKEAQNAMDKAAENDQKQIGELTDWIDNQVNGTTGGGTTGGDDTSTTPKISTLVGTVVDKNTKAIDAYGNKITIPKGFKVLEHNPTSNTGAVTYNYTNSGETGEHIPAVQDGIVIENGIDKNQFVWVPVGTIKNKDNTTNTITLGRYEFDSSTGKLTSTTPAQVASVENCTQAVTINNYYQELSVDRTSSSSSENTTARNLAEFISTSLANGGYYISRFEASGTTSKITTKYNQTVLTSISQLDAAKLARNMYGDTTDYASDLVNSYAWDTAIIFIQTYSTGTDASSYAGQNKSTSFANTGINNDKYCNIWDMSGNAREWTTEYSTWAELKFIEPCVYRGGLYSNEDSVATEYTSKRNFDYTVEGFGDFSLYGLRPLLYVK